MTLGADIDAALPGLRAEAESRMKDTVQAGKFADGTDPAAGDPIRTLLVERYSGRGRIRWGSREVTNAQGPGMPVAVQEPYLSIPFGSPRLRKGDEVLVTASDDPVLVGQSFRVTGRPIAGQVTAHRYPLEEIE